MFKGLLSSHSQLNLAHQARTSLSRIRQHSRIAGVDFSSGNKNTCLYDPAFQFCYCCDK